MLLCSVFIVPGGMFISYHLNNVKQLLFMIMIKLNIPCNFVAQRLAGDDSHLLTDPLVDVEVITQAGVVLLDYHPG